MSYVQVLMSTYNGSEFLREQIESVLNQSYHKVKLLVRDDGSTDSTKDILKYYLHKNPERVQVIWGSNIGVINSFFELLNIADHSCDFYCFCDQDDVWFPDKIDRALRQLNGLSHIPAMVCTTTYVTDKSLKPLNIWPKPPARQPSFFNAVVQNIAVGATITLNKRARELIIGKAIQTEFIQMHDWWTYLCVSAFGKVIFDSQPSILYRQHGRNTVGGETSFYNLLIRKWKSFRRNRGKYLLRKQAAEFNRIYGHLLNENEQSQLLAFLEKKETLKDRLAYLNKCKLYRNSPFEQLIFKFLILIGYI